MNYESPYYELIVEDHRELLLCKTLGDFVMFKIIKDAEGNSIRRADRKRFKNYLDAVHHFNNHY